MTEQSFPISDPEQPKGVKGVRAAIDKAVRNFQAVNARIVSAVFDKPRKNVRCPECGGTDFFDGTGTFQICPPM